MPVRPRALIAVAVSGLLLLGACGEDDAVDTEDAGDVAEDGSSSGLGPEVIEVTGSADEKPTIELNGAGSVEELYIEDVTEGDGDEVGPGAEVEVHYVGVQLDGEQFDASWDRGQTATFPLDGVIAGWTEGIPGMKVGGRRLLVIPSDMAYGDDPSSGRPTGTLVFVVDLVAITGSAPEPVDPEGDGSGVVGVTGSFGEQPTVALNGVEPVTEVAITDVIVGEGAEVTAASTVSVHFLGLLLDGTDAGSTWTQGGEPTTFSLTDLPAGIRDAIVGMRAGGRRLFVGPTSATQPEGGAAPPPAPGDTVVYVFDVLEVMA